MNKEEFKNLNLRINEILSERKLTKSALAEQLGVSVQYIINLLNGTSLSINALVRISRALDVPVGDLFMSTAYINARVLDDKPLIEDLENIIEKHLRVGDISIPLVTELMAAIYKNVDKVAWSGIYRLRVRPYLPDGFVPDYGVLSSMMTLEQIAEFENSLQ